MTAEIGYLKAFDRYDNNYLTLKWEIINLSGFLDRKFDCFEFWLRNLQFTIFQWVYQQFFLYFISTLIKFMQSDTVVAVNNLNSAVFFWQKIVLLYFSLFKIEHRVIYNLFKWTYRFFFLYYSSELISSVNFKLFK